MRKAYVMEIYSNKKGVGYTSYYSTEEAARTAAKAIYEAISDEEVKNCSYLYIEAIDLDSYTEEDKFNWGLDFENLKDGDEFYKDEKHWAKEQVTNSTFINDGERKYQYSFKISAQSVGELKGKATTLEEVRDLFTDFLRAKGLDVEVYPVQNNYTIPFSIYNDEEETYGDEVIANIDWDI